MEASPSLRRGRTSGRAPEEIARRFAELAPWYSRFEIDGRHYGGDLGFQDDTRVASFFSWVGRPGSILELGSLEGAHTVELAAPEFVERVQCVEGRKRNSERARAVMELLGLDHVSVATADLEDADLRAWGHFDAAFVAGVLYHLTEPWLVLERLAEVADTVFLDTHYSLTGHVDLAGYQGRFYGEHGVQDAFSGLREASFWPTFPSLVRMALDAGFVLHRVADHPTWPNGPRTWLLLRRRREAAG
jgi:precorrin-6B methylase 2